MYQTLFSVIFYGNVRVFTIMSSIINIIIKLYKQMQVSYVIAIMKLVICNSNFLNFR